MICVVVLRMMGHDQLRLQRGQYALYGGQQLLSAKPGHPPGLSHSQERRRPGGRRRQKTERSAPVLPSPAILDQPCDAGKWAIVASLVLHYNRG